MTETLTAKVCKRCGQAKALEEFNRNSRNQTDGRQGKCRKCESAYNRRWAAANPDWRSSYRKANPGSRWEERYRRRMASLGLDAVVKQFTHDQLIHRYGDQCVYCGGPFEEIDHVKPLSLGGEHSIENVRPCCGPCNRKKWTREIEVVDQ